MEETTSVTRRVFMGTAVAMGAAAAFGAPAMASTATSEEGAANATSAESWHDQVGFWVDTKNCVDCGTCAHACRRANNTPEDEACRRKILICESSSGDTKHVSVSCMHCSNPSCVSVCPAGALSKREADGIVVVDKGKCIGCRYCYQACPFGVPHYTHNGMDKCDCCVGNEIYPEQTPACADACPHDALHFGSIDRLQELAGPHAAAITGITGPSLIVS